MRKIAGLLLVVALALSLLVLNSSFAGQSQASRTWVVDRTGIDADFRTISDAINSAESGTPSMLGQEPTLAGFILESLSHLLAKILRLP
jgi:hypothetical protein